MSSSSAREGSGKMVVSSGFSNPSKGKAQYFLGGGGGKKKNRTAFLSVISVFFSFITL